MNSFKKISYLIFAMALELLLCNFLFSMEEESEDSANETLVSIKTSPNKNSYIDDKSYFQYKESQYDQKGINAAISKITSFLVDSNLRNQNIKKTLIEIKNVLIKLNKDNKETNRKKLKEANQTLRNQTKMNKPESPYGELHTKYLLPYSQLNKIIQDINNIIRALQ